jgi:hypothetical protein
MTCARPTGLQCAAAKRSAGIPCQIGRPAYSPGSGRSAAGTQSHISSPFHRSGEFDAARDSVRSRRPPRRPVTRYLDTSAAAKLLVEEDESDALVAYLDRTVDGQDLISSALLETELRRLAIRIRPIGCDRTVGSNRSRRSTPVSQDFSLAPNCEALTPSTLPLCSELTPTPSLPLTRASSTRPALLASWSTRPPDHRAWTSHRSGPCDGIRVPGCCTPRSPSYRD